jgi:hypothetical protein
MVMILQSLLEETVKTLLYALPLQHQVQVLELVLELVQGPVLVPVLPLYLVEIILVDIMEMGVRLGVRMEMGLTVGMGVAVRVGVWRVRRRWHPHQARWIQLLSNPAAPSPNLIWSHFILINLI